MNNLLTPSYVLLSLDGPTSCAAVTSSTPLHGEKTNPCIENRSRGSSEYANTPDRGKRGGRENRDRYITYISNDPGGLSEFR